MKNEFIPVTGNTQELQFRPSPSQKWFTAAMNRNENATHKKQMASSMDPQGMYVLGPDGKNYGFTNDHYPEDIQKFINTCLAKYKDNPPKQIAINAEELNSTFSKRPPRGAAVVRVYARIWPLPDHCWGLNHGVGRDFLWLYPEELKYLATVKPTATGVVKMPAALSQRLLRFHLLDDVRGTPDMWRPSEIQHHAFNARVISESNGDRTIKFYGKYSLKTRSGNRGFVGSIQGEVGVKNGHELSRFKAYADGKAWGRGTYTPFPPDGKYGLHIGFVDAHDEASQVVPPEAVSTANNDLDYHNPFINGEGFRGGDRKRPKKSGAQK